MTRLAPTPTTTRPIPRRHAGPIDPGRLAEAVARAYVEIRSGRRPQDHLRRVLSPAARRRLRAVVLRHRGTMGRMEAGGDVVASRLRRIHANACESVVVIHTGSRATAVAVRLDRRLGRWWVTDLGAPEDRQPLPPTPGPIRSRGSA